MSFCPWGGEYRTRYTPPDQVHPLGRHPPGTRYTPRSDTPLGRYPPGRHPLGLSTLPWLGLSTPPWLGLSTPPPAGTKYTPLAGTKYIPLAGTKYNPPADHGERYGQHAGGTHPTGMKFCSRSNRNIPCSDMLFNSFQYLEALCNQFVSSGSVRGNCVIDRHLMRRLML